jgi:sodium pump decarboxylase gamma subunit
VDKFFVGVQVTILGMVVVLSILLILYLAMVLLYRFAGSSKDEKKPEKSPKPKPQKEPDATLEQGKHHDPKVIAAITAAVLAACDADQPRMRALRLNRGENWQWRALGRAYGMAGRKK